MRSAIFYSIGFVALFAAAGCKSDTTSPGEGSEKGGSSNAHSGGSAGQAKPSNGGGGNGGANGGSENGGGSTATAGSSGSAAATGGSAGSASTGKGGSAGGGGKGANAGESGSGGSAGKSGTGKGGSEGDAGSTGAGGGGTGGATSSGDDGGGADAAAAGVEPTCASDKCTFAWGKYKFVIDMKGGARIIEFSLDGTNFLVDSTTSPDAYGSTFLTSPQKDFPGWPPPTAMDSGPYTKQDCDSTTCLRLASAKFSVTGSSPSITLEKKFSVNATSGVVTIVYSIVVPSDASGSVTYAPWEVTRAKSEGLTFWPTGTKGPIAGNGMKLPTTKNQGDYTFYAYSKPSENSKLNADGGPKGYIAQVNGDLMLVKAWQDVPTNQQDWEAEGEIELYVSPGGSYIEVEEQGPYGAIAAGKRVDWTVRWSLQKLAAAISSPTAAIGDSTLTSKADSMATMQ